MIKGTHMYNTIIVIMHTRIAKSTLITKDKYFILSYTTYIHLATYNIQEIIFYYFYASSSSKFFVVRFQMIEPRFCINAVRLGNSICIEAR